MSRDGRRKLQARRRSRGQHASRTRGRECRRVACAVPKSHEEAVELRAARVGDCARERRAEGITLPLDSLPRPTSACGEDAIRDDKRRGLRLRRGTWRPKGSALAYHDIFDKGNARNGALCVSRPSQRRFQRMKRGAQCGRAGGARIRGRGWLRDAAGMAEAGRLVAVQCSAVLSRPPVLVLSGLESIRSSSSSSSSSTRTGRQTDVPMSRSTTSDPLQRVVSSDATAMAVCWWVQGGGKR